MDKQKTQRIIGILVIIAFVIVLIPLFFGKTEVDTQVVHADKTLALPDQKTDATTLAKADTNEGQTPEDSAILGSQPNNADNQQLTANNQSNSEPVQPTAADTTKPEPISVKTDDVNATPVANEAPANAVKPVSAETAPSDAAQGVNIIPQTTAEEPSPAPAEQPVESVKAKETITAITTPAHAERVKKHHIITAANKHSSVKAKPLTHADLAKLTSTAWVVQMGNFRDKNNARRLADKLRVAGYKAFTKEIKSAKGFVSTRVYIGPEFKQASAKQLSSKVEQEMKMHGIVISIKPLEL